MGKVGLLILLLFVFTTCAKDKVSLGISMDGMRSVLVGEWDWQYSHCRILTYSDPLSTPKYYNFSTVKQSDFNITHHIRITSDGWVYLLVNGNEVGKYKLTSVKYEDHNLEESFYGVYAFNDSELMISFTILEQDGNFIMKTHHDLLTFPSGTCSNNFKPETHFLKKIP